MNRQEIFEWVKATYGTEPDYPWNDWNAVLRHKDNNKWYGVVMEVAESKLGLTGDKIVDLLNVKCDPILIGSLRQQKGYFPAYHMNKDSWISILLDGSVPSDEINRLMEINEAGFRFYYDQSVEKDLPCPSSITFISKKP